MRKPSSPLYELTIVRVKEFLREPEAVFWTFLFPILLAICLGLAFRDKPADRTPVGVLKGPGSAELAARLSKSPGLTVRTYTEAAGGNALRSGKISLLLLPGPVFKLDPTRPDARLARLEVEDALRGANDRPATKIEEMKEPGARYIDFLIPGILGMNVLMAMWGLGFPIVNARLRNLLKRLSATPMKRWHYLLSQILARLFYLPIEVFAILGFARIAFDITVRGSVLALWALLLVGVFAFSGVGLLIAARTRTIEGLSGLMNLVMLPMWLLSGVFFSYERFPDAALPFIRALPLTALNDGLRAVINGGAGLGEVTVSLAILAAWGLVTFVASVKLFVWK